MREREADREKDREHMSERERVPVSKMARLAACSETISERIVVVSRCVRERMCVCERERERERESVCVCV